MKLRVSALNRKLLRDLWHLRGQALAIALVIASGIATWIIAFSTIDSLNTTQAAYYRENRFADIFAHLKRAPSTLAPRIAALPGVEQVQTRVVGGANLEVPNFGDPVAARIISLPDTGPARLNRLYLRAGRLPRPYAPHEVVVSEPFAEAHHLGLGSTLSAVINGRRNRLKVVGIGLSPEYIYQIRPGDLFPDYKRFAIIWMRRKPLAAAWGMTDAFNDVTLTLQPGADPQEVIDRLDHLLKPYGSTGAYTRADQTSHKYLTQEIKGLRSTAAIVPFIFLGVAAFLLNVVMSRIVEQQREQVAVLKAFGYSNRAVGGHYIALILTIVVIGAIPGIGVGAWLGHGLARLYSHFFRYPYLVYLLRPSVVIEGVAVAMAAGLFGAWRAVRRASRLPPAEAMRPEPPTVYRATLLERVGAQRLFDQPTRMILRHLERRPLKSLLAVLGIAMAGAILMVGNFQKDSIDYIINVQFNLGQREDLTVTFTEPTDRRALYDLESLPGVIHAEPVRAVPVELHAGHRHYRTAIQGFENGGDLHRPLNDHLHPVRLPHGGLLLSDYIGKALHVKAGDWVTVSVLEGAQPVRRVKVVGLVKEFIGASAYMRIGALNRLMREGSVISGAFLQIDPAKRQEIFDRLKGEPRVGGVAIREVAIRSFYDTMGETLLIFAFINTLLAGTIAFGVIYNSARITLSEHSRELASLRVLGFTRGEIAYILLGELALLTLAAIPPAFLIGREFCRLIARSVSSELYRIPLVLEPSTYGFSALVVLVAMVVSALIMRHRLYHLDLVGVLKMRE